MKWIIVSAFLFLLAACSMPPISDKDGKLVYTHMHAELDRAVADAESRCKAQGLVAKREITQCWIIGDWTDVLDCSDTVFCESCQSTFTCLAPD